MHHIKVVLALVATTIAAQRISTNDVPQSCSQQCDAAINLYSQCNNQYNDNQTANQNQQFRQCICQSQNAQNELSNCNQCILQYQNNQGYQNNGNNVQQWMQTCGFQNIYATTTGPYGSNPTGICSTYRYTTSYYNGNDNDNNNRIVYTTICPNQPYYSSSYYPGETNVPAYTTSYTETTITATYNGQTYTSTALLGVDPNGYTQTLPTEAASTIPGVTGYTGAAAANALPYYGAAGGFMMAAFAL